MKFSLSFLLLFSLIGVGGNHPVLPNASDDLLKYNGSISFGVNSVGDNPFSQLYSFYHNDELDPSDPTPPYDPNIIGYGIKQHSSYPFNGNTEVIAEKSGHLTVLELDAFQNGYMEGIDIPDSPSSGSHSIEFWWAWNSIDSSDYGNTPRIHIQTENGFICLSMKTHDPYNRWYFLAKDNNTNNDVYDISTETATLTIDPNEFFHCRFTIDLDADSVTYWVFGDITVTGTLSIPFALGKIQWFSFGTLHSYTDVHWLDSLSWTWDDDYTLGDLLTGQPGEPPSEIPNIWDYWFFFVIGAVALGGIAMVIVALTKKKSSRKTPPQDFGTLSPKVSTTQCPGCGMGVPSVTNFTEVFCPYCGNKLLKK